MMKAKIAVIIGTILLFLCGIIFLYKLKSTPPTREFALTQLEDRDIKTNAFPPVKESVSRDDFYSLDQILPELDHYMLIAPENQNIWTAEIFADPSVDNAWIVSAANAFNEQHKEIDGNTVGVSVRLIPDTVAMDYITTGKYVPDGYAPTSRMWEGLLGDYVIPIAVRPLQYDVSITPLEAANVGCLNPYISPSSYKYLTASANTVSNDYIGTYNIERLQYGVKHGFIDGYVSDTEEKNVDYQDDAPLLVLSSTEGVNRQILQMFADWAISSHVMESPTPIVENMTKHSISAWRERFDKMLPKTDAVMFIIDHPDSTICKAVINSMQYIPQDCKAGIITGLSVFSPVLINAETEGDFKGAINATYGVSDGSSIYDSILVAEKELKDYKHPAIIVVSSSIQDKTKSYRDEKKIIEGMGIPIYTIGSNVSSDILEEIALLTGGSYEDLEPAAYELQNILSNIANSSV